MARLYTEIRIPHSTKEEKEEFEKLLDEALKKQLYSNRVEWIKDKARELIKESNN